MKLKTKLCSSLAKVLPATAPEGADFRSASALQGEIFSFQMAYCPVNFQGYEVKAEIESTLSEFISCYHVELIPVDYPGQLFDDDYISTHPGLFPDRLGRVPEKGAKAVFGQWRAYWIKVALPKDIPGGKYEISITLSAAPDPKDTFFKGKPVVKTSVFTLEVIPLQLPEQTLTLTNWFHADCLASYYKQEVFSEAHWQTMEKFFRCATAHGINLLLTPLFTLPLDTAFGHERPTCQLVKVRCDKGQYSFDFSLLTRWITLAQKCGFKEFEMSHLFSQWGAEYTPKIVATVDGCEKRIGGWDVRADSAEYIQFIDAFLPALTAYLKEKGLQDKVYFHCSDEPQKQHTASYIFAAELLKKYLNGFRILDALTDVKFYRMGYVTHPVPLEAHLDPFIKAGVPELWTYYCCGPADVYPNRLIAMPSSRNRVLGSLLYYYDIKGFLHWGFNFYYSQYSLHEIDPYRSADAGATFPAGDAFVVYPGVDGEPENSLRHEVFFEALQDQRALQLLERFMSRKAIQKMLDKFAPDGKMTMKSYPKGEKNVLAVRKKINTLLKKFCNA